MPKQAERSRDRLERRNSSISERRTRDGVENRVDLPPPSPVTQAGRGRPRDRRHWLALAGALLLLLIAGLGLIRWRSMSRSARRAAPKVQEDPTETRLRRTVEARPDDEAARRELGSYY